MAEDKKVRVVFKGREEMPDEVKAWLDEIEDELNDPVLLAKVEKKALRQFRDLLVWGVAFE